MVVRYGATGAAVAVSESGTKGQQQTRRSFGVEVLYNAVGIF